MRPTRTPISALSRAIGEKPKTCNRCGCPERTGAERKRADIPPANRVVSLNYGTYEALNFVDGKRSLLDIAHALFSEYGVVRPADVEEFIQAHVKAGNLRNK